MCLPHKMLAAKQRPVGRRPKGWTVTVRAAGRDTSSCSAKAARAVQAKGEAADMAYGDEDEDEEIDGDPTTWGPLRKDRA